MVIEGAVSGEKVEIRIGELEKLNSLKQKFVSSIVSEAYGTFYFNGILRIGGPDGIILFGDKYLGEVRNALTEKMSGVEIICFNRANRNLISDFAFRNWYRVELDGAYENLDSIRRRESEAVSKFRPKE